jgi:hypothetical protein
MAAAAGREADVGVCPKRPVDDAGVGVERFADGQAGLAGFVEGRRLRADPHVLPFERHR